MSHIDNLNLRELTNLQEVTSTRIKEIRSEPCKIAWAVEDAEFVLKYFREEQYLDAADYLSYQARNVVNNDYVPFKTLRIECYKVPQSEYEGYFE